MKKHIIISLFLSLPFFAHSQSLVEDLMSQNETLGYYQNRYPLKDPYTKLVDNSGNGFNALYGVRNFRAVLNGVVYRGGANNTHNKYGARSNSNPLPNIGLQNLCKEGFGTAIYLYNTNYNTAPKTTACASPFESKHTLNYIQQSPLSSTTALKNILNVVYKRLSDETATSPIYVHCWNGWHASGYTSAIILRQFCGYTGDQAVNYWNLNTDGNNVGSAYNSIRTKIRAYKVDPSMSIASSLQAQICPAKR